MHRYSLLIFFSFFIFNSNAQYVDTISVYSKTMNKDIRCVVISPSKSVIDSSATLYLLHGYSGRHYDWVKKAPVIIHLSVKYNMTIVCPDGNYDSWYVDSPMDSSIRYETFITKELIHDIEKSYPVFKSAKQRAISGLSMGGHGALNLAVHNPGLYAACGSMSGAVDLAASKRRFLLEQRLGSFDLYPENWNYYSITQQVDKFVGRNMSVIIDCGVDDFFYDNNKEFHAKLVTAKVPHDYIERPGKHDWAYWNNAIEYQMLFFWNVFNKLDFKY